MNWKEFAEILLIPPEGKELAIRARVQDLMESGGLPSFIKGWEPVGGSKVPDLVEELAECTA